MIQILDEIEKIVKMEFNYSLLIVLW